MAGKSGAGWLRLRNYDKVKKFTGATTRARSPERTLKGKIPARDFPSHPQAPTPSVIEKAPTIDAKFIRGLRLGADCTGF